MYSGHTATHIPDIWLSSISASTCCLSDGGSELRNDPGSCDVSGPADAAACRACSARCTANTCHIDRYIVITAQQGHLSSIPLIQFWIGILGKTHSKTYSVSLTKYARELQKMHCGIFFDMASHKRRQSFPLSRLRFCILELSN
mgnify:CR=1 FL=1